MIQGANIQRAPSPSLVLPHFGLAALAFLLAAAMILLVIPGITNHYFQPAILSITHILALGWITMIIFGALYQLVPVILEQSLFSEALGFLSLLLLTAGTILLSYSFWSFRTGMPMQAGGILLFLSFLLFSTNIFMTIKRSAKQTVEADFIFSAILWLLLTGAVGTMLVFNFQHPFLPVNHLQVLKLHAHIGLIGWMVLLIIGVGSKLIPMFLVAHDLNTIKLKISLWTINTGLPLLTLGFYYEWGLLIKSFALLLLLAGFFAFFGYLRSAYKKSFRKVLDTGMQQTTLALVLATLPVIGGIYIVYADEASAGMILAYGTSAFAGFISALILGQTFKTLPFIVWLHQYRGKAGKTKIPLPKELFSEKIATAQMYIYTPGFLLFLTGLLIEGTVLLYTGGSLLLLAAMAYNYNVFKIIFHRSNA